MPTTNFLIRPYLEADEACVIALWAAAFPHEPAQNVPLDDIRRKLPFSASCSWSASWTTGSWRRSWPASMATEAGSTGWRRCRGFKNEGSARR